MCTAHHGVQCLCAPVACLQVAAGTHVLDLNMDDGLIEGVGAMTRFVNLLVSDPEISRVPFMIDSSKFHIVSLGHVTNHWGVTCMLASQQFKLAVSLLLRQY